MPETHQPPPVCLETGRPCPEGCPNSEPIQQATDRVVAKLIETGNNQVLVAAQAETILYSCDYDPKRCVEASEP